MKILLIEDHPIFRFGVRQLIVQRWPQAVIGEATTLETGLQQARTGAWDLALVDLNLPDAVGIESISQLHRAAPQLRLLVLSFHAEEAYATQVMRRGAMGYMTKEHATDELVTAIEQVAAGGRYISHALAQHLADRLLSGIDGAAHEQLGPQEYRVMLQLAAGRRPSDIAVTMHLSPKTVSTYRARILEKLGVASNAELAHYCLTHRLSVDRM